MDFVPFFVMKKARPIPAHWSKLPSRIRISTSIAGLYALGKREEVAQTLRIGIKRHRLTRRFFSELFLHLSLFLGYPPMLDGFETLDRIRPARRISRHRRLQRKTLHSKGLRIFRRIYGSQAFRVLKRLEELHPELPHRIVEDAYGCIISRSGLTLQERELVNVVVLALGGYQRQLFSHLRGALRAGVPPQTVRVVLAGIGRVVGKSAPHAMSMIDVLDSTPQQTEQSL